MKPFWVAALSRSAARLRPPPVSADALAVAIAEIGDLEAPGGAELGLERFDPIVQGVDFVPGPAECVFDEVVEELVEMQRVAHQLRKLVDDVGIANVLLLRGRR